MKREIAKDEVNIINFSGGRTSAYMAKRGTKEKKRYECIKFI